jgi:hypothetical protein
MVVVKRSNVGSCAGSLSSAYLSDLGRGGASRVRSGTSIRVSYGYLLYRVIFFKTIV